ncbi:hypothetical protein C2S51_029373 [Perilla frutescens var. frutescens]|nr:hypothetical protein C2S51_029373 [Perilla frutescens var. frutescens]
MARTKNASNASNTIRKKKEIDMRSITQPCPSRQVKNPKRGPVKSLEILPPSESTLQESLNFSTKLLRDRYAKVCERPILPGKNLDLLALERLGIRHAVEVLIDKIGWKSFFEINYVAFIELTREFYTTFQFVKPDDLTLDTPGVIKYRESRVGYGNFGQVGVWSDMSVDRKTYDPSQSQSTLLKKPEWQYIHRFLSFKYSARKSDQINVVMEKKKGLILGSVITQLAINHGLLDLQQHFLHKAHDNAPLDEKSLERMGIIEKKDGVYKFRALSTPLPPKELCRQLKRSRVEVHDPLEGPDQSTLTPPTPTMFEVMQRLDQIAQDVSRIRSDINAYFSWKNFHPPPSTS